jgi:ribonucleoside-diphosphate reductase alpha chain
MSDARSVFAQTTLEQKYLHTRNGKQEDWGDLSHRVATHVMGAVDAGGTLTNDVEAAIFDREFVPGGRYLAATGRPLHQTQNCALMRADDSREGWGSVMYRSTMALMTGAGVGIVYSGLRAENTKIRRTGGVASGPLALAQMVNEGGRFIRQGGDRRAALWGGLHWNHPDVFKFMRVKDWSPDVRALKAKDYNHPAPLDGTNISVILDDDFFRAYRDPSRPEHQLAQDVYWEAIRQSLRTGEPGFSIDVGVNAGEHLRNACTEITSADDDDICNLGSINMARVRDLDHMRRLVRLGIAFLLAGTVYSDIPYVEIDRTRTKNRRLGLGLMGVHEWLAARGKKYGPDEELEQYLRIYAESTGIAHEYADAWKLSRPVKTRALAPTGTISIVTETTSGIEPIFCVAFKRRYLEKDKLMYQYVIDPTAARLIESGVDPSTIEDAYSLAEDVERRVNFQAWMQTFVDHGISSTINLPAWGTEHNNESTVQSFGDTLMRYLPSLRGITCYPDGARSGQPLQTVKYETAMRHRGEVFLETADVCDIRGGNCG